MPPDDVLDAVEARVAPVRAAHDELRWTRRAQWHLTLQFLGAVPDVDVLLGALQEALAPISRIDGVGLAGAGAFPSAPRASVVWLGIRDGAAALTRVAEAVEWASVTAGFAPDARSFAPHLTVARVPQRRDVAAVVGGLGNRPVGGPWVVDDVVLVSSDTRPNGRGVPRDRSRPARQNGGVTPPRLFGIVASKAPIVAVLRRGPSAWTHVGKWDLAHDQFEGGAWIKSNLYPQRCDVSPDGELFAYLAARGPGTWAAGSTYLAIARLPWVFALAAWGTCGTWTRGVHFVTDQHDHEAGDPDEGTVAPMRERYGLAYNRPVAFTVERRGGWVEAEGTPPRDPDGDPWDEQRAPHVVMEKPQPGTPAIALRVQGSFAAFREGPFRNEPHNSAVHVARRRPRRRARRRAVGRLGCRRATRRRDERRPAPDPHGRRRLAARALGARGCGAAP